MLMLPGLGLAVGMSDIDLESKLNQPFKAEVNILELGNVPLGDLKVKLAPKNAFAQINLDRPTYLKEFKFKVQKNANGQPVIKITTQDPLTHPVVSFLVSLSWPNGQLYREYTVFLDPPDYENAAPVSHTVTSTATTHLPRPPQLHHISPNHNERAGVTTSVPVPEAKPKSATPPAYSPKPKTSAVTRSTATASQPSQKPLPRPQLLDGKLPPQQPSKVAKQAIQKPATQKPAAPSVKASTPVAAKTSPPPAKAKPHAGAKEVIYGPTTAQDNLWEIAKTVRPNETISLQQVAMAILKQNPRAFSHQNVNGLKSGYTLKVPSLAQMQALTHSQALHAVNTQNAQWKQIHRHPAATKPKLSSPDVAQQSQPLKLDKVTEPQPVKAQPAVPPPVPLVQTHVTQPVELPSVTQPVAPPQKPQAADTSAKAKLAKQLGSTAGTSIEDTTFEPIDTNDENAISELQAELALSIQAIKTAQQQNKQLNQRVDELTAENKKLQDAILEKNQEILTLEKLIAGHAEIANAVGLAQSNTGAGASPGATGATDSTQKQTLPFHASDTDQVKVSSEEKQDSSITEGWIAIPIALILIIMLLSGGLYWRRRNQQLAADEEEIPGDILDQEEQATDADEQATPEATEIPASDEMNVVEEASVLIAYGRYRQAEKLLVDTLSKVPENYRVRLTLLEVYALMKDKDAFDEQLEGFPDDIAELDPVLWKSVEALQASDWENVCELPEHEDAFTQAEMHTTTSTESSDKPSTEQSTEESAEAEIVEDADTQMEPSATEPSEPATSKQAADTQEPPIEKDSKTAEVPVEDANATYTDVFVVEDAEDKQYEVNMQADLSDKFSVEKTTKQTPKKTKTAPKKPFKKAAQKATTKQKLEPSSAPAKAAQAQKASETKAATKNKIDKPSVEEANLMDFEAGLGEGLSIEKSGKKFTDSQDMDDLSSLDKALEEMELETAKEFSMSKSDDEEITMVDIDEDAEADDLLEGDSIATKLDLARAYIDMGDHDEARTILDEVIAEGNDEQRQEAEQLIHRIDNAH